MCMPSQDGAHACVHVGKKYMQIWIGASASVLIATNFRLCANLISVLLFLFHLFLLFILAPLVVPPQHKLCLRCCCCWGFFFFSFSPRIDFSVISDQHWNDVNITTIEYDVRRRANPVWRFQLIWEKKFRWRIKLPEKLNNFSVGMGESNSISCKKKPNDIHSTRNQLKMKTKKKKKNE